jgi:glucose/mannose transport system substrate-binding protein
MPNRSPLKALAILVVVSQASFCAKAAENSLEVFSWWTSGGESAALDALFNVYKKRDPGVEIVNAAVAGGGGSAARPVLQTRLAGGNPPDTWQSHPGWELLDQYVEPGYCEPITELYKSDDWDKAFPKELVVDLMTKDRKIYAVLAGIHRGNVLWYNTKLLEQNGIKVGGQMTFDQFFTACDKLKSAGIPALGVGDSDIWASAQLFENTLLGVIGPKGWTDLFAGAMQWDDPKVKEAMKLFAKMQEYMNPDHAALSWDQAIKELMEGKVAFSSMGDWVGRCRIAFEIVAADGTEATIDSSRAVRADNDLVERLREICGPDAIAVVQ